MKPAAPEFRGGFSVFGVGSLDPWGVKFEFFETAA